MREAQARLALYWDHMRELREDYRRVRTCYAVGMLTPRDERALRESITDEARDVARAICQIMRDMTHPRRRSHR